MAGGGGACPRYLERLEISRYTRMYAGYQMGLVATALFPVVGPPGTTLAATLFMVPNLSLFLRDWLLTTGRMQPDDPRHLGLEQHPAPHLGPAAAGGARAGRRRPGGAGAAGRGLVRAAAGGAAAAGRAWPPGWWPSRRRCVLTLALAQGPSPLLWATDVATLVSLLGGAGPWALWREDRLLLARAGEDTPPDGH